MEIITSKLKASNKIIEVYEDYFTRLDPLLQGQYSEVRAELDRDIKKLPNLLQKAVLENKKSFNVASDQSFEKSVYQFMNLYGVLQSYYDSIDHVFNVFDENYLSADNLDSNDLSKTYKLETEDLLNNLRKEYNRFKARNISGDAEVVETLTKKLLKVFFNEYSDIFEFRTEKPNPTKPFVEVKKEKPTYDSKTEPDTHNDESDEDDDEVHGGKAKSSFKASFKESIQYFQNLFRQFPNTLPLYANTLQKLVDTLHYSKRHSEVQQILGILEYDKTFVLKGTAKNRLKGKGLTIHHRNPPLKTFGFIPVTDLLDIKKLIPILLNRSISGKVSFSQMAKSESACVIIITRITYNPIEYNIQALIGEEKAKPLVQDPEYGITTKVIERFNTIRVPDKATHKWKYDCSIIGNQKTATKYYVVETIDGKKYRALAPWMKAINLGFSYERVKQLLDYLKEPNKPTRVACYQKTVQKAAVQNMFLRRALSMDIFEEHSTNIDTQTMRNRLFVDIKNTVQEIIKSDFKNGASIKGNTDVNDIIHDERIKETFTSVILQMYRVGTSVTEAKEFSAGKFPFSELVSSYISDLQWIQRRFMKELHDGYNRKLPSDDTFKVPVGKMKDTVVKLIDEVLLKTIQIIINDSDNIYSTLNHKYLILNFN